MMDSFVGVAMWDEENGIEFAGETRHLHCELGALTRDAPAEKMERSKQPSACFFIIC